MKIGKKRAQKKHKKVSGDGIQQKQDISTHEAE